jgi:predicted nucleic acid-binding protein
VTRYLLDTNIVSNPSRPHPSTPLMEWLAAQDREDLFIASLTLAELRRGVLEAPDGKRRRQLEEWFDGPEGPQAAFVNRVLPFDETAALAWAHLMSDGVRAGRPRSGLDMIIAATAEAHSCVVVTDNEKHFAGLNFINPLRA